MLLLCSLLGLWPIEVRLPVIVASEPLGVALFRLNQRDIHHVRIAKARRKTITRLVPIDLLVGFGLVPAEFPVGLRDRGRIAAIGAVLWVVGDPDSRPSVSSFEFAWVRDTNSTARIARPGRFEHRSSRCNAT